jgi:uncharacterized protein YeeX (DUF496 family)
MDFKNSVNRITIRRQDTIAKDVRDKNRKINDRANNVEVFRQGSAWFNSGLSLEDADEILRNDKDFISGYNRAKRIKDIEISLYNLGMEYFNDGISFELIPSIYQNNPIVIKGYEDAMTKVKHKL